MGNYVLMKYLDGKEIPCAGERFMLGMKEWELAQKWEKARGEASRAMEEKGEDSVDLWRRMIDFEEIGQVLMETRRALLDN